MVLLASLGWLLLTPCGHATPRSYAEFKRLPVRVQRDLVADEANPQHLLRIRWWWHLQIGDQAWLRQERIRLIKELRHGELLAFFQWYVTSKQNFLERELDRKEKLGMSTAEQEQLVISVSAESRQVADQFEKIIPLLATVKRSDAATRLNEQADKKTAAAWTRKDEQADARATTALEMAQQRDAARGQVLEQMRDAAQEMAQEDAAQRQMLEAVRHLPRYSPQETRPLLDALPPEYPTSRSFHPPYK